MNDQASQVNKEKYSTLAHISFIFKSFCHSLEGQNNRMAKYVQHMWGAKSICNRCNILNLWL